MGDLETVAAALNVPEEILSRSAAARADATGSTTDEVLAAWAGGDSVPSGPPPSEADGSDAEADGSDAEAAVSGESHIGESGDADSAGEASDGSDATSVESVPPAAPAATAVGQVVTPPPQPSRVTRREALSYPIVISVPTAGVTERTAWSLPRWLAAVFVVLPVVGLLYLTGNSGAAECNEASYTLAVDRATGEVRNCDGTEFQGRAGALGGAGAQFFTTGQGLYASQACVGCHGPQGGGGSGPALTGVGNTFSSCQDHIEWVQLGTAGFQAAGRATYGDLAKPVGGGGQMPAFAGLSPEDLAAVVAFERIQFGQLPADEVLASCGLVEAPADGAAGATTETSETMTTG